MSTILLAFAHICGTIATACATAQYMPQLLLNWRRHSTHGLSASSIILKLVGASFLLFNSIFLKESMPVVLYGLGNVITHVIFMLQFHYYAKQERERLLEQKRQAAEEAMTKEQGPRPVLFDKIETFLVRYQYLLWALFPLVPLLLDVLNPSLIRLLSEHLAPIKPNTLSPNCCGPQLSRRASSR